MTTDEEWAALVRAVCASPGDDLPRLVCADWLDDHGESDRVEFVRAQVELANETRKTYRPKLERRIKNLLRGAVTFRRYPWVNEWLDGPLKCGITASGWKYAVVPMEPRVHFARGFVSQATCTADVWLRHADAIAWRPGWEMDCGICRGSGLAPYDDQWGCGECGGNGRRPGSGRVPRPFPGAGCQPIESVTLTDFASEFELYESPVADDSDRYWVAPRWPGVTFTLPRG